MRQHFCNDKPFSLTHPPPSWLTLSHHMWRPDYLVNLHFLSAQVKVRKKMGRQENMDWQDNHASQASWIPMHAHANSHPLRASSRNLIFIPYMFALLIRCRTKKCVLLTLLQYYCIIASTFHSLRVRVVNTKLLDQTTWRQFLLFQDIDNLSNKREENLAIFY